ncbi:MAG: hypothetical protein V3U78_10400, partial [Thiotrichaceae bacterium]
MNQFFCLYIRLFGLDQVVRRIKTGMRLRQGREVCPDLIQAPSRPERYAEISTRIMHSLIAITPDIEVFS